MTEARLAQESLRESEQLARNIIETSLDAFVQTDERGTILNWNSQAEKLFGWPREEAMGKNAIDLIVAESERRGSGRPERFSNPERPDARPAAASSWCGGATARNSGPSSASRR